MESWLQRVILTTLLSGLLLPLMLGSNAYAQNDVNGNSSKDEQLLEDVIQPDIQRRDIDEAKIDTENWEFGIYTGVMSIEDFGTSDVNGIRLAFHVTEDFFFELGAGLTKAQPTSFELLSGSSPLLTEEQRDIHFYHLDVGYAIFPGEIYLGRSAFNTNLYIVGGAGNTVFADNEYFTYNYGVGLRIFTTDWIALHFDFRNYLFTHALFGEDKKIQNLEYQIGLSLYL